MACTVRYTKVGETQEVKYTEAEFVALLAEGELDVLRKSGKIDLSDIKDFIKEVSVKDNNAAKNMGFDSAEQAIKQINNATGNNYMEWGEIPPAEKGLVSAVLSALNQKADKETAIAAASKYIANLVEEGKLEEDYANDLLNTVSSNFSPKFEKKGSLAANFLLAEKAKEAQMKDKKIVMTELKALKKQMEDWYKGFKEGVRTGKINEKNYQKELSAIKAEWLKAIAENKEIGKTGRKKLAAIARAFDNATSDKAGMRKGIPTKSKMEKLFEYLNKFANDAQYETKVNEAKKLAKNVNKKRFVSPYTSIAKKFANIDIKSLGYKINDYIEALKEISGNTPNFTKIESMLDDIINNHSKKESPFDEVKSFDKLIEKWNELKKVKVNTAEDYLDFKSKKNALIKILEGLIENETNPNFIKEYENKLSEIKEEDSKLNKDIEKQVNTLKDSLADNIVLSTEEININDLRRGQAKAIKQLLKYKKQLITKALNVSEIDELNNAIENYLDNGYFDLQTINDLTNKIEGERASDLISIPLNTIVKKYTQAKEILNNLYKFNFLNVEKALGLKERGKATYEFIYSKLNNIINNQIKKEQIALEERLHNASKSLGKGLNRIKSSTHIGTTFRYLDAQFGGKADWLGILLGNKKALEQVTKENVRTILSAKNYEIYQNVNGTHEEKLEHVLASERNALFKTADKSLFGKNKIKESLEESYKRLLDVAGTDGIVDKDKVKELYLNDRSKLFSKSENKFLNEIESVLQDLSEYALDEADLNGRAIDLLDQYMTRLRMGNEGTTEIALTAFKKKSSPKGESSQIKERVSDHIGAVETNVELLLKKAINDQIRKYYLKANESYFQSLIDGIASKVNVDMANALKQYIDVVLQDEYINRDDVWSKRLQKLFIGKIPYNIAKGFAEFAVGLATAPLMTGKPIKTSIQYGKKIGRLFGIESESPLNFAKKIGVDLDIKKMIETGKWGVDESVFQGKDAYNKFADWALDNMGGATEHLWASVLWQPEFDSSFRKITGENFDMQKWENDKEYKKDNQFAVESAAAEAEFTLGSLAGAPLYGGKVKKIAGIPLTDAKNVDEPLSKSFFASSIMVLANFQMGQYHKFMDAVTGKYGKRSPLIASGVILNQMLYPTLMYTFGLLIQYGIAKANDDDDEAERIKELIEKRNKELTTPKGFATATLSSIISTLASGTANIGKAGHELVFMITIQYACNNYKNATTLEEKHSAREAIVRLIAYADQSRIFGAEKMFSKYISDDNGNIIEDKIQAFSNLDMLSGAFKDIAKQFRTTEADKISEDKNIARIGNLGLVFGENNENFSTSDKAKIMAGATLDAFNDAMIIFGKQAPFTTNMKQVLGESFHASNKDLIIPEKDINISKAIMQTSVKDVSIKKILDEKYNIIPDDKKNFPKEEQLIEIENIVIKKIENFYKNNKKLDSLISNEKKRSIIKGLAKDFYDEAIEKVLPNLEPIENLRLTEEEIKARQLSKEEKAKYPSHVERDYAREINKTINRQNYLGITPDEKKYINIFSKMSLTEKGKMINKLNDKDKILAFIRLKQVGALGEEEDIRNLKKIINLKDFEKQIEDLRKAEQAEYDAMSNQNDKSKQKEIYDRYDKLITPLLEENQEKEIKEFRLK